MRTASGVLFVAIFGAYAQTSGISNRDGAIPAYPAGSEPACNNATRASVIVSLGESGQPDLLKVCTRDAINRFSWVVAGQQNPNTFTNVRTIGGCPIFPDNNVWNSKVDSLPKDPASSAIIGGYANARVGLDPSMSINLADGKTPSHPVSFSSSESDLGLYPVAGDMRVEGYALNRTYPVSGGPYKTDAHLLVIRTDT